MRGHRVLHLHGLQHDDQITRGDLLALLDGDLHDGALHRRGDRVTRGGLAAGGATLARLRLLLDDTGGRATTATTDGQIAGQRHLDATATDLDDDLLTRRRVFVVQGLATGERLDRVVPLGLDPAGVHVELVAVTDEGRVGDHSAVERDDRGQTLDVELRQRTTRAGQGLVAGGAADDQLGQHRVELTADDRTALDTGVHADAGAGRGLELGDRAGSRQEAATGVLAVDPELERVATRGGVLGDVQGVAVGDLELLQHQVDARGLLGDRVFHLQTGVDLEEADQAVLADQILDGARTVVAGFLADALGRLVDLLALRVGQERRGGLLDELLEAALQGAVAGTGDDDVAVRVGDDLSLDVARLVQVALDEALATAEGRDGLTGGRVEQLGDLLEGAGDLHAAAATAEGGLDGDRQAVLLGERQDLVGVLDRVRGTRHQRRVGLGGDVARGDLVAEVADGLRARPDPDQPGVEDGLREVGVLGQEAVARVDGVGARLGGGVQDLIEDEVGLGRGLAAQGEGLVGKPHVRRIGVRLGVNGDAGQSGVLGSPDDPDGNLSTVGD